MQIAKHLQNTQPSYIREILKAACSPDVISLAGGLPDGDSFPLHLMEASIKDLPQRPELFQYGGTAGYQPLLEFVAEDYGLFDHQSVMVTTGSQQGLDLIARSFLDKGDCVVMEAPSYLGALQVFSLAQADVHSIEQNELGPDLDALKSCFSSKCVKLFYAVPDFHNPTGVCWSLEVRKAVAELCQRYSVLFVEDAPYRELRFNGDALPMVSSFCPEHALTLRSYSKIATPGIRVGTVSGPESWIHSLIKLKQCADLHSNIPMQAVLLSLISSKEFPEHIQKICQLYGDRYRVLAKALEHYLPDTCEVNQVNGGMFVWMSLPDCNSFSFAQRLLARKVAVVPSTVFYHQNTQEKSALRLNYTNASDNEITQAVEQLALEVKALL